MSDGQVDRQPTHCLMCLTLIQWLGQAWPEAHVSELPRFEPREALPMVRVHSGQADPMPFCQPCGQFFMQAMAAFHRERQQREGQEPQALTASVRPGLARPQKQIILPGQPGFVKPGGGT